MSVINSQKVLYSAGKNDECYTPDYAVLPILPYIRNLLFLKRIKNRDIDRIWPLTLRVWCPFDTPESQFVKQISKLSGVEVIYSHIDYGQDFFEYEPADWDCIVSNPPFTAKRKYFERALGFGKPFALIMSNTWLNDAAPKQIFKERGLQLMMFDKRIKFIKPDGTVENKITFSCSYFCCDFLPQQIILENLAI